jgi:putative transposase
MKRLYKINMEKFNGKYRIPSARLPNWDYASAGMYFITICTKDKIHFFGECVNGKMQISTIGLIVQGCWYDIPNHTSANIILDEFVVMPNHIHGILILGESLDAINDNNGTLKTLRATSLPNTFYQKISPKSGSISRILGSFKSACSKHINLTFPDMDFDWQERFWDNIIRDDERYETVSNYIMNNPKNWNEDKFFNE